MLLSGLLLAALALALAWPVPLLLHRYFRSADDAPAALILWQAIGLAGGISLIAALVYLALSSVGPTFPAAFDGLRAYLTGADPGNPFWHLVLLIGGLVLAAHMLITLVVNAWRAHRHRRRHYEVLQLVSTPSDGESGVRILHSEEPVAYCLPAGAAPITVVSTGLLTLLDTPQREAVIAHEAVHVRQRHDLFMLPFLAWRKALPWLYAPEAAMRSVNELVELLADDAARRVVRAEDLSAAVSLMNDATLADRSEVIERRLDRLSRPHPEARAGNRAAIVAVAAVILALPFAIGALPLL